jgi:hypothetical protein
MPWPRHHPAARQGDRRLLVDQRAALHPRPARGLRPLAPARQCRLELRRRAALFPQGGGSAARRRRPARGGWAALRVRHGAAAGVRCLHRGGGAMRLSTQSGLQWRRAGGFWLLPAHHAQRAALLGRGRLSQAGAAPAESPGGVGRARDARAVRWTPRRRHRISPRRRDAYRAGARGDPFGRHLQYAATAAALRARSCVIAAAARHPGHRRPARHRRRPAGPLSCPHGLSLLAAFWPG